VESNQPRQRRSQRSGQGQGVHRAAYASDAPQAQYPNYPQYPAYGQHAGGQYEEAPGQTAAGCVQYPQYAPPGASSPYQRPQEPQYITREYAVPTQPPEPVYRRRSREWLWRLITIVCIALLAVGVFWFVSVHTKSTDAFHRRLQVLQAADQSGTPVFLNGVLVDKVHIGGLTLAEAQRALNQTTVAQDRQYAFSVTIDGKTWRITQNELPLKRNIDDVLQEALSIGRQGSLETLQSGITPFAYRWQACQDANYNGAYLYTQVTYDKGTLRQLTDKLSEWVSNPARDATVASFDFATRAFQYIPEQSGTFLSSDDIFSAIAAQLDAHNYNGSVTLYTSPQQPTVTMAQLQQSFGLIASYETDTLPDRNRNKNIELACAALNGTVVESGKTLSFNAVTGRRSVDKGYLLAGAIAQGRSYEETGGGVCQLSSTLFNAAAMANMQIVSSSPHAWPSAYVEPGRDATVDWQSYQSLEQSLDLKIKNTSPYPIYIAARISDTNTSRICLCTVEIFGVALNDGVRILLETELAEEPTPSPTPKRPEIVPADETHPAGTEEVIVKGREGYKYKTYRVFYRGDDVIKRELLRTSVYKPYAEQVRIYE